MTRVFVYEYVTGGGLLFLGKMPSGPYLREGLAMVTALAADFASADGVDVTILQDRRLPPVCLDGVRVVEVFDPDQQQAAFAQHAAASDWSVVIAPDHDVAAFPEFDVSLLSRCQRVVAVGGRLLGPGCELVQLAADKQATADHLSSRGIPVPRGIALELGEPLPLDFPCPAVLKPRHGAGSVSTYLIESWDALFALPPWSLEWKALCLWSTRLEAFCPGTAASVSVLGGASSSVVLPPCKQRLSHDGRFKYLGGSLPLPTNLAHRAQRLADRVIDALPEFFGYLGIDLVLGPDEAGREDYVIEINPRLTTSYVGLRVAARENLAEAMLQLVHGDSPKLSFRPEAIEFNACNGSVWTLAERT